MKVYVITDEENYVEAVVSDKKTAGLYVKIKGWLDYEEYEVLDYNSAINELTEEINGEINICEDRIRENERKKEQMIKELAELNEELRILKTIREEIFNGESKDKKKAIKIITNNIEEIEHKISKLNDKLREIDCRILELNKYKNMLEKTKG